LSFWFIQHFTDFLERIEKVVLQPYFRAEHNFIDGLFFSVNNKESRSGLSSNDGLFGFSNFIKFIRGAAQDRIAAGAGEEDFAKEEVRADQKGESEHSGHVLGIESAIALKAEQRSGQQIGQTRIHAV